jgi:molybdopterin converting factor small subunit
LPVRFLLPSTLRPFANGSARLDFAERPATVGDALALLGARHPGVRDRVLTEQGEVRPHVNVFVGDESIRYTGGLATPLADHAEVSIVPAVSGGAPLRLLAVLLLLLAQAAGAATNADKPHPRLGLYGHSLGDGTPLVLPDGDMNAPLIAQIARYDEVVLSVSPFTEYRSDVLAEIRRQNPGIKLYAYIQANYCWPAYQPDSLVNIPTRHYRLIRDLNGYLYKKQGGWMYDTNINLAKKSGNRFVVAEGLADFFRDAIVSTGKWDGIFFDRYCNGILWQETPTETIDYQRAGYTSLAAFDAAWRVAADTLANRLRRIIGPTPILIGNCAQGLQYGSMNGWMREDFPNQTGTTWDTNMFRTPGGYMTDEANFRSPQSNWIATSTTDTQNPYSPEQVRKARWGLGSAAMGDGFAVFNPWDLDITTEYMSWWYDEYAVNPATGRAVPTRAGVGWLGKALGPMTAIPTITTDDATQANPGFELDLTGWTFGSTVGATVARDLVNPGVGTASAKVHVPALGATTLTSVDVNVYWPNSHYVASFWARSSAPRALEVAAVDPVRSTTNASGIVSTDATWRHFEVPLDNPLDVISAVQFRCGGAVGDVWIDDVHFYRTGINVYRRDFERGIVLVNPNGEAMPVLLEQVYRRIQGMVDPANDGSSLTTATIPGYDALFLIRGSALVGAADEPREAGTFAFSGAYPNPAPTGAACTIRLAGAQAGPLHVAVFDAAGRLVRTVFDGEGAAGPRAFSWDGKDEQGTPVARGLYFVRAAQGSVVITRKLVRA